MQVENQFYSAPSAQFARFVCEGKKLAERELITWEIRLDHHGVAAPGAAWDLRELSKDGNPTGSKLRQFSTLSHVANEMRTRGLQCLVVHDQEPVPVSPHWQDLMKAYVLQQVIVAGRSLSHVSATCNAMRHIATVTNNKAPWLLAADDIDLCLSIALAVQSSGQSAIVIRSFVKTVLDAYHLVDAAPLLPLVGTERLRRPGKVHQAKYVKKTKDLKIALEARKSEEKLPEMRAFWEFMRIVFTEKPKTFSDAIRFAQGKLLTITGLRIGEIALLPLDWKRTHEYYDQFGDAAGKHGGVSRALLLRHYSEKQGSSRKQGGTLWEESQYIPAMFERIACDTLEEVERLTAPLRRILKAQCETRRLLPMYDPGTLLPVVDLYLHLTGMVLTTEINETATKPFFDRYRENYDPLELDRLVDFQRHSSLKPRMSLYQFAVRLKKGGLVLRDHEGNLYDGRGALNAYVRVSDAENYIREQIPTKLSDLNPFQLDGGRLVQPWEMLFLLPKRALGEGRDKIPCHVGRIISVGLATQEVLRLGLSSDESGSPTLFEIYGETDEDRRLSLLPHSLRHLQNTELFRLGVADTIITKRFNRRSVSQSYEYDHRSLQEELTQISLPDEWEAFLGDKASTVAKMIKAGRANGPIVKEFKRIQVQEGDEAAYTFLKVEADGFHATPYGHCLNSFTVDPCPTHLECFNGCVHLSATDLPANRRNLVVLEGKLKDALELARAKDSKSIGRENQIRHAEVRLANIARLMQTAPGELAFPDGEDLSRRSHIRSVLDGA